MKRTVEIIGIIILMCASACQKHLVVPEPVENEAFELFVGSAGEFVVKSPENPEFTQGTLFHIYGTKPVKDAADDWSDNYIKAKSVAGPGVIKGISGDVDPDRTRARRINTYDENVPITSVFRIGEMNLYGVTAVCAFADYIGETDEIRQEHNAQLESWLVEDTDSDIPAYNIHYNPDMTESLPDVMWSSLKGLTPVNNAGKISMPFTHTLSKLNFIAVQAPDLNEDIVKMQIKSLSLKDYPAGRLSMENGLYTREGETDKRATVILPINFETGKYVEVLPKNQNAFGSCLIFPTTNALYDEAFGGFATPEDEARHAVLADLTIVITKTGDVTEEKTFSDIKLIDNEGKAAAFHPNTEYFVTFTLTTNQAVITLIPRYYDYIDDVVNLGNEAVGEPTDFGGVLWAAQNLGAISSNPTLSAIEWEYSRGFYYQYGRNVPFYVRGSVLDPYPDVLNYTSTSQSGNAYWDYEWKRMLYEDGTAGNVHVPYGNTAYSRENNHGARANPYIPILWENEIRKAGGNTTTGYKNFLAGTRLYYDHFTGDESNGQSAPSVNQSDPYEAQEIIDSNGDITRYAFSCYYGYKAGTTNTSNYLCARYWDKNDKAKKRAPQNWVQKGDNESNPCPKGWRVPSVSEFYSIIPTSVDRGDIAFNTNPNGGVEAGKTPHSGKVLWTEKADSDYLGERAIYIGVYQDGRGYNDIGTFKFWSNNEAACKQGWGTIYGIKRLRTSEAYGIRWEIVTVDYDPSDGQREDKVLQVMDALEKYPKIGRGVLVISKYDFENQYDIEKICLTAEATGVASSSGGAAQYVCRGFIDSDDDMVHDTGEVKFDIDWDHPSGKLYLPIPGYVIVPSTGGQGLLYPGTEALYWTSDTSYDATYGYFGQAVRIKQAGDNLSRFLYVSSQEHIANGANIRCVRDTQARD